MKNYAYSEPLSRFREELELNTVFARVERGYIETFGRQPGPGERRSWEISYPRLVGVLKTLPDDTVITLEERMPIGGPRADMTLCGSSPNGTPFFVIIELKAWSQARATTTDDFNVPGLAGIHQHPACQANSYCTTMQDFYAAFQQAGAPTVMGCAFCFNLDTALESDLIDGRFSALLKKTPIFDKNDFMKLREALHAWVGGGGGTPIRTLIDGAGLGPSRKLLDHANAIVRGQQVFQLLGEQQSAQNAILAAVRVCTKQAKRKKVILVEGGPGTGKSVVALNAFAAALPDLRDDNLLALVSGSGAFTHSLRTLLPREKMLLRFTDAFWNTPPDGYQLIIVDEAHRIRERSEPKVVKAQRPTISQLEELVRATRVLVLLMDENQIISPREVGHPANVRMLVDRLQKDGMKIDLKEFVLPHQFRCRGSEMFVDWLDALLDINADLKPFVLPSTTSHRVHIVDSPHELKAIATQKNKHLPNSARLMAGWCWPWSNPVDGKLVDDVKIGDFSMPWELKNNRRAGDLPEAKYWAINPSGEDQIGTVYSVQGFEMAHICVIFGPDLVWRAEYGWVAQPKKNYSRDLSSKPPSVALPYLKRIYRTLLMRGMESCTLYFVDSETRAHFEQFL